MALGGDDGCGQRRQARDAPDGTGGDDASRLVACRRREPGEEEGGGRG